MALRVTIRNDAAPQNVKDGSQLDEILSAAAEEARKSNVLGVVLIEAENGNVMAMVVGGEETVLGFDYGHQNPPYYASRGAADSDEPRMTCHLMMQHHTEFPRKFVIPTAEGVKAVRQFLHSNDLPTCINWEEI